MIRQAVDPTVLQGYVTAVRDKLDDPELRDSADRAAAVVDGQGDAVTKLRTQIPSEVSPDLGSSGSRQPDSTLYLSRDPVHSLLQSTLDEELRAAGVPDQTGHEGLLKRIIGEVEAVLHPVRFGPDDPGWVTKIAKGVLDRLGDGNHPFNPKPAEYQIKANARVIIVGDWGTGLDRARAVAGFMADEVSEALAGEREVHVIHLGDVYYSGLPGEVKRNFLAPGLWPVSVEQSHQGVTSWSLNGNHDMYGGGHGYFETLLADERFTRQHSPDGAATSFFRLTSPAWDIVGLDTSWDRRVLAKGFAGVLEDPQGDYVASVAGESSRKLMLLSHHQLVSVYSPEDIAATLPEKLRPVLTNGRVGAWIWGHEHRCMGFQADQGVPYLRCIGHGGVPVPMTHAPGDPIAAPGAWEERDYVTIGGRNWGRFGFAVFDFDGPQAQVRYRNDLGAQTRQETLA
jgi:Calcineurin-like phosphoesterase